MFLKRLGFYNHQQKKQKKYANAVKKIYVTTYEN